MIEIKVTIDEQTGAINIDTGNVAVVTLLGVAEMLKSIAKQKLHDDIDPKKNKKQK